jgi:chitodextrinase
VANVDGCGYKGWHGEPYYAAILFYDPALLAAVVAGQIEPNEVQPYAMLNLEDRMFQQGCRRTVLGGVGFDRARGLLYVLEREVAGDGYKPIVHVFRLAETAQPVDVNPPSPPANLRVEEATAHYVDLSWDGATDNGHLAGYVIYRFGEPIATTAQTSYRDDKVNPSSAYTYTVAAWDASNNLGQAASIVVTTPGGNDARAPILYDIRYQGLGDSSITVGWRSDEPATTVVTYELAYSGDVRVYRNEGLTRQHEAILTGLTPESTYTLWRIGGTDATGQTNEFFLENWEFVTSPPGQALNFAPVLNGIGSRRAKMGGAITFTVDALDRDADDLLTFSAADLPPGAALDPNTGRFTWTPTTPGLYPITIQVSDGDQTDSERVTLFVE